MNYKCKFCDSTKLFIEVKNTSTGLYCSDCGKWQKWLNKDEVRAFNQNQKLTNVCQELKSFAKDNPTYVEIPKKLTIENRLQEFIDFLDEEINRQFLREKLSIEDNLQACVYAHAYEKDKNALINILNEREWNNNNE
ncbi:MAG: hypothetical protein RR806_08785 [Oscillospiraceae bacterium]